MDDEAPLEGDATIGIRTIRAVVEQISSPHILAEEVPNFT
jgi:hypothetical protein